MIDFWTELEYTATFASGTLRLPPERRKADVKYIRVAPVMLTPEELEVYDGPMWEWKCPRRREDD